MEKPPVTLRRYWTIALKKSPGSDGLPKILLKVQKTRFLCYVNHSETQIKFEIDQNFVYPFTVNVHLKTRGTAVSFLEFTRAMKLIST